MHAFTLPLRSGFVGITGKYPEKKKISLLKLCTKKSIHARKILTSQGIRNGPVNCKRQEEHQIRCIRMKSRAIASK